MSINYKIVARRLKKLSIMNSNLLRHRLLGILARQYIIAEKLHKPLGVSFKNIETELKSSESDVRMSLSELYENDEIRYHDAYDIIGVHATETGVASFSNKKYWRIYWTNLKDSVKYWFQILVPILSLLVALIAVTHDLKEHNEETSIQLKEMKSQIELLRSQVEQQKIHQNDSLIAK